MSEQIRHILDQILALSDEDQELLRFAVDEATGAGELKTEPVLTERAVRFIEQVIDLPLGEQRQIAGHLYECIATAEASERDYDPVFQAELERRLDEARDHPERLLDARQVLDEAREMLRKRTAS